MNKPRKPAKPRALIPPEKKIKVEEYKVIESTDSFVKYNLNDVLSLIKEIYGKDHVIDYTKISFHINGINSSDYWDDECNHFVIYSCPGLVENKNYEQELISYNRYSKIYQALLNKYESKLEVYNEKMKVYNAFIKEQKIKEEEKEIEKAKKLLEKHNILN